MQSPGSSDRLVTASLNVWSESDTDRGGFGGTGSGAAIGDFITAAASTEAEAEEGSCGPHPGCGFIDAAFASLIAVVTTADAAEAEAREVTSFADADPNLGAPIRQDISYTTINGDHH